MPSGDALGFKVFRTGLCPRKYDKDKEEPDLGALKKKIEQEIKIWMKVLTDFQTDSRNTLIPWHALTKYLT